MTQLYLIHAATDRPCVATLSLDLGAKGFVIHQDPHNWGPRDANYPRAIEHGIVGSRAVILVWSEAAQSDDWVTYALNLAQRTRKPIFAIALDDSGLPAELGDVKPVQARGDCVNTVAELAYLPSPTTLEPLDEVCSLLGQELIRERRKGIEQARVLLKELDAGQTRETLLALLDYFARHDLIGNIRDLAREVLAEDQAAHQVQPNAPFLDPAESRHMIGVRCKNLHVTWFDKRRICADAVNIKRAAFERGETTLDELRLKCGTCGETMTVRVDCEGYQ